MLKIVQIIPDDRDVFRCYDRPEPFFGPAPTALLEGFVVFPSEVEVHVISCVRRMMPAPEKLAENIFYHQVPVSGGYRRTLFIEAIRKVRKIIQDIRPDIVHGQGTEDYPGLCAAFSGRPNCITIHGNMRRVARQMNCRPFPQMAITAFAESVALQKTDAVICNSVYTEQCVGSLNHKKIRIPNAVRSSFFNLQPPADRRPPSGVPVLLCLGTIVPYKNQLGLIKALDPIARAGEFRLVFAGRCDPGSEYVQKFLAAVGGRSWCDYAGHLETGALQGLLSRCAGVVHPTLEDSFGLAVAEAQAAGIPVAASRAGGLPDLIEDGRTGLLFDPECPADIRDKVVKILDCSVSAGMALISRAVAEERYRAPVVAQKHFQQYKSFLVHNKGA